MVRRIVEHVVANITENQSGKHGRCQASEKYEKKTVEKKRKRNAYAWRHDEPSSIVWIIVMNTVNNVVHAFSQTGLRFIMKYVTVNEILEKCPEQNTD